MTASPLAIFQTQLDNMNTQLDMAEQHQTDLDARLRALHRPCNGREIRGVLGNFYIPNQSKFAMVRENKFGYAEVVDTSVDAIKVMAAFENTVSSDGPSPGFQLLDFMVVLQQFPTLQEIYNDRTTLIRELRDLTPEESDKVYEAIAAQTSTTPGVAKKKALAALDLVRELYDAIDESIERFNRIKNKALAIAA